jgi:menaquinol-cytochrome c reductase iron-sulfur subunit
MKKASSPPPPQATGNEPPRRNLLAAIAAVILGGISGLIPTGAGLAMLLDPVLKRKKAAASSKNSEEHGVTSDAPFLRVTSLNSLPADGTPMQVPVLADLSNAWTREVNQPIGAVYLSRTQENGKDVVKCFNAICPHAGCFVAYSEERKAYQCPCHTSAFELSGERIMPSPSPRSMDELAIDAEKLKAGEVWVQFVNYYPGKEHREAKA